jgi:hypothetical protein
VDARAHSGEQADSEVQSLGFPSSGNWKEPALAGKKRPKSLAPSDKKKPAKAKRPKKTSRGK